MATQSYAKLMEQVYQAHAVLITAAEQAGALLGVREQLFRSCAKLQPSQLFFFYHLSRTKTAAQMSLCVFS